MSTNTADWFTSWFNTPYYHILYKDRGHEEAEVFMKNLTQFLNIPEQAHILDLACGKGRHSVHLNSLGYQVTGLDLSEESIAYAKQFENSSLHFDVHDMSTPYHDQFDAVFNLFTSFGYFENEEDNLNTIKAIKANLKPNGIGVIDFMNVDLVINNLVNSNEVTNEGITFSLNRKLENGYIVKDISFNDNGQDFRYQERVRAFTLDDFKDLFEKANVELIAIFGDYKLNKFRRDTSDRLIMIFM